MGIGPAGGKRARFGGSVRNLWQVGVLKRGGPPRRERASAMALTVSVAIATRRRKAQLETLLACIAGQTRLPDQVVLAPTDADADLPARYPPAIAHHLSLCPPTEGLTKQRNACL